MPRKFIIPAEIADLFDDYGDYRGESFVRSAVEKLVENHREEYEELVSSTLESEVNRLEVEVRKQRDRIAKLEKLNPKNVNVPILTETANKLQKAVENKESKKRKRS